MYEKIRNLNREVEAIKNKILRPKNTISNLKILSGISTE